MHIRPHFGIVTTTRPSQRHIAVTDPATNITYYAYKAPGDEVRDPKDEALARLARSFANIQKAPTHRLGPGHVAKVAGNRLAEFNPFAELARRAKRDSRGD